MSELTDMYESGVFQEMGDTEPEDEKDELHLPDLDPQPDPLELLYVDEPRMDAYYYAFNSTGNKAIDGILSAVAWAGKGWHNTESWCDEPYGEHGYGPIAAGSTAIDVIQEAANRAAVGSIPHTPTGIRDSDGTMIREGDVLECMCEGRGLVRWDPRYPGWGVSWISQFPYVDEEGEDKQIDIDLAETLEEYISWHIARSDRKTAVIGNVYDTPGLERDPDNER